MKGKVKILLSATFVSLLIVSCQDNKPTAPQTPDPTIPTGRFTKCTDPRPQACTREFRPVCSQVDTGVRCVTTPCPSTENKTAPNACTACSNPKVHGYWLSACPE
ncbi:MAG: hypothetical protein DSZ29_00025 [Aquificaceae bacterium]|nr:MAG: hypothetical protein DSZ29_00025 [Aquificaceae bacterium]